MMLNLIALRRVRSASLLPAIVALFCLGSAASAENLTSATLGLNYIGQGQCTVVNGGNASADLRISIIDAPTANMVAGGGIATILPGTSMTLPYQATSANRRDFFCEVTDATPGAELRMVFKRVSFNGDVSDFSDGLPGSGAAGNNGSSAPGSPGAKTIFVTSTTHNGDLGGLDGANDICQGLADSSSLVPDGEYVALLSGDEVSAASRLNPSSGPFLLPNGVPVAENLAHLFGVRDGDPAPRRLVTSVRLTEAGTVFTGDVWTGTQVDGFQSAGNTCLSWTTDSSSPSAVFGRSDVRNETWIRALSSACHSTKPIYCVQR